MIYTIFPDESVRIHLFEKSYNGTTEVLTENTSNELMNWYFLGNTNELKSIQFSEIQYNTIS